MNSLTNLTVIKKENTGQLVYFKYKYHISF